MNKPIVSVGIPTYNRALYLYETILSVINQVYESIEIIISDNASTDNTQLLVYNIMKNYPNKDIKYYRQEKNIGVSKNWKYCLEKSNGDFFILLSDDDILSPEFISEASNFFNYNDIYMINSKVIYIDANGNKINYKHDKSLLIESGEKFIKNRLVKRCGGIPSAEIFNAKIIKNGNCYNENFGYALDLAAEIEACALGKIATIDKYLVKYRIHGSNAFKNYMEYVKPYEYMLDYYNDDKYKSTNIYIRKYIYKRLIDSYISTYSRDRISEANFILDILNKNKKKISKLQLIKLNLLGNRISKILLKFRRALIRQYNLIIMKKCKV